MAFNRGEDEILSPIHFGSSLVDSSINSDGSLSSFKVNDVECAGKVPVNQFSGLDSREDYDVFSPLSDNYSVASLSKKSSLPLSPLTFASSPSKRLSSELKIQSSREGKSSLNKNARLKKEKANNYEKNPRSDAKGNNDAKCQNEKLIRPTTLSPLKRWSEECGLSHNKAAEKIVFPTTKAAPDATRMLSNSEEKRCDDKKEISEESSVIRKKSALVIQDSVKKVIRDAEEVKRKQVNHDHKKKMSSSSGSNLEDQVIQRMVEDSVSFEADKIRQILYSQQMMFLKRLNEIKMSMEQQHLQNTNCLFQLVEALAEINLALKEKRFG